MLSIAPRPFSQMARRDVRMYGNTLQGLRGAVSSPPWYHRARRSCLFTIPRGRLHTLHVKRCNRLRRVDAQRLLTRLVLSYEKEHMKRCPFCDREHHTDRNVTGDLLLCPCGAKLLVQHRNGGTLLIVAGYPSQAQQLQQEEPRDARAS